MTKPKCESCGSDNIHINLTGYFDPEEDRWIIEHFATEIVCSVCCAQQVEQTPKLIEKEVQV